jgi:PilZ domain
MPIPTLGPREQTGQSGVAVARRERRQNGRAKVSREMRIRAADYTDGSFEEVRSTLNFSRNGFYFFTSYERYYAGMRLRIAPAAELGTEGTWENLGQVVRVHRQGAGFGVAVALLNPAASRGQAAASPGQAAAPSASKQERRSAARQSFVASTEVIDVRTGDRSRVRTADLSTQGCYIDTMNPLPLDSTARLRIEKENVTVEFRARVISSHPGSGMGLEFEGMTGVQRSMLAEWLRGESVAFAAGSDVLPRLKEGTESEHQFAEGPSFLRLLSILTSKGILSESEAASLLRDL